MKYQRMPQLEVKKISIKLGSLAVSHANGGVNTEQIRKFASDIASLMAQKTKVCLVTSGAINCGRPILNDKKNDIHFSQAAAAIGQSILMQEYRSVFKEFDLQCAQILLTHEDLKDRQRSLNLKNTIELLLEKNIVPIINENDSVSFEEISFGDNDQLAAGISELLSVDALILFTESGGLYNKDPKESGAHLLTNIPYEEDFKSIKIFAKTGVGKGGMDTKLMAIRKLCPQGITVLLGAYQGQKPILELLNSSAMGSLFAAKKIKNKKVKMLSNLKSSAFIKVDFGAQQALEKNASLLPVGILGIHGKFKRGDVVAVKCKNQIIAYGYSEYDSSFLSKIIGKDSESIAKDFPKLPSKIAIHKNNLLLKREIL